VFAWRCHLVAVLFSQPLKSDLFDFRSSGYMVAFPSASAADSKEGYKVEWNEELSHDPKPVAVKPTLVPFSVWDYSSVLGLLQKTTLSPYRSRMCPWSWEPVCAAASCLVVECC
jgi:hypothetical protein